MLIFVLFYQGTKIEICFSALALPNRQGLAKLKKKDHKTCGLFHLRVIRNILIGTDSHLMHLNLQKPILNEPRKSLHLCATRRADHNIFCWAHRRR